jgi:hypothetical protein
MSLTHAPTCPENQQVVHDRQPERLLLSQTSSTHNLQPSEKHQDFPVIIHHSKANKNKSYIKCKII